jgi:hypothetical protein
MATILRTTRTDESAMLLMVGAGKKGGKGRNAALASRRSGRGAAAPLTTLPRRTHKAVQATKMGGIIKVRSLGKRSPPNTLRPRTTAG